MMRLVRSIIFKKTKHLLTSGLLLLVIDSESSQTALSSQLERFYLGATPLVFDGLNKSIALGILSADLTFTLEGKLRAFIPGLSQILPTKELKLDIIAKWFWLSLFVVINIIRGLVKPYLGSVLIRFHLNVLIEISSAWYKL